MNYRPTKVFHLADQTEWFPFGRPGAGAPLKLAKTQKTRNDTDSSAPKRDPMYDSQIPKNQVKYVLHFLFIQMFYKFCTIIYFVSHSLITHQPWIVLMMSDKCFIISIFELFYYSTAAVLANAVIGIIRNIPTINLGSYFQLMHILTYLPRSAYTFSSVVCYWNNETNKNLFSFTHFSFQTNITHTTKSKLLIHCDNTHLHLILSVF